MAEDIRSSVEVEEILKDYYKTMSNRDWKQYKTLFVERATLTTIWPDESDSTPRILTNTIDDFISKTKDGPYSQPIFEEKMLNAKVSVRQNLAQGWVDYSVKFGSKENLNEWYGNDLISLIKFDGEWKIVSMFLNQIENKVACSLPKTWKSEDVTKVFGSGQNPYWFFRSSIKINLISMQI